MIKTSPAVWKIVELSGAESLEQLDVWCTDSSREGTSAYDPMLGTLTLELIMKIEDMKSAERKMAQHLRQAAKAVEREQERVDAGYDYVDTTWIEDAASKLSRHSADFVAAQKQAHLLAKLIKLHVKR